MRPIGVRGSPRAFALATLACAVASAGAWAPSVRAASGPCAATSECVAGQVCRLGGAAGTCTWEATDRQTLIDAIVGAHADGARDVIFIGDLDPKGGGAPVGAEIHFETQIADDAGFGPRALPKIRTPLTIEGAGAATSILDIDADIRLFLLEVDPATDRRPDLLLKSLTIRDARPGPDAPGAGAVTVTSTPTSPVAPGVPELAVVTAEDTVFVGGRGPDAGAVHNLGAPARFERCTFTDNEGTLAGAGAGAVSTSSGAVFLGGSFTGNRGVLAGAVASTSVTYVDALGDTVDSVLQISGTLFDNNAGDGGAVHSLSEIANISNATFRNNAARVNAGGAILGRNLNVSAGTYEDNFAQAGGGAIAVLDAPPSAAIRISGAVLRGNTTNGRGGGVVHTGASLVVDQSFFEENSAGFGGGGLSVDALAERNGAVPDVRVTGSSFRGNVARPEVSFFNGADLVLDELGGDVGSVTMSAAGSGAALYVTGSGVVEVDGNCIVGNAAAAVTAVDAAVSAGGNWWGASDGPSLADGTDLIAGGGGDFVENITSTGFLTAPAPVCANDGFNAYPQLFIPGRVEGTATVVDDFRLLDLTRGIQVLQSATAPIVVDTHFGSLAIRVEGVNDDVAEGGETFVLSLDPCSGDGCAYLTPVGNLSVTMSITDNGNGDVGEGEGEGEDCDESLSLSTTSLTFTGVPPAEGNEQQTLTITNDGPCDVQLLRPFIQAGASQGFVVQPILQANLAIPVGGVLQVVVEHEPGDPEGAGGTEGADEPDVGSMRIETAGGFLAEVGLAVAPGCACGAVSGERSAPVEAGAALLGLVFALARRRRTTGLPKPAQIP